MSTSASWCDPPEETERTDTEDSTSPPQSWDTLEGPSRPQRSPRRYSPYPTMSQRGNKATKEKGEKDKDKQTGDRPQTPAPQKRNKIREEDAMEEQAEKPTPMPNTAELMEAIQNCQAALTSKIDTIEAGFSLLRHDVSKLRDRTKELEARTSTAEDTLQHHRVVVPGALQRLTQLESRAEDAENRNRRNNLRIVGIPEGAEGSDAVSFLEELLQQLLPDAKLSKFFAIERAHRLATRKKNPPGAPPRPMIFKLLNYKDRDAILSASRIVGDLHYENTRLMIFPDFTNETQKLRRSFQQAKTKLREREITYAMLFPARLRVQYNDEALFFDKPEGVITWLESLPANSYSGIKINWAKSILFPLDDDPQLTSGSAAQLQKVSKFKYLGDLRLVNGPGICAGRVEIFYRNSWGSVCDDSWDIPNAQVVCRQLECGIALSAIGNAFYGMSNGLIWMDDVECSGNESNMTDCRHNGWGSHNCIHDEDASVICSESLPKPTITISASENATYQLQCIVPNLFLNLTVYLLNGQSHVAQAAVTQTSGRRVRVYSTIFTLSGAEHQGTAEYACSYEVNKEEGIFKSPPSVPLCVVHQENGNSMSVASPSALLCNSSSTHSPTNMIPAYTDGISTGLITEVTGSTTMVLTTLQNSILPSVTPSIAEHTASTMENSGENPFGQHLSTELVTVISLLVTFTVVLLVLLVIFLAYRRRPSSSTRCDVGAKENDYVDPNISKKMQWNQKDDPKSRPRLEVNLPSILNANEVIYEGVIEPSNDSLYETKIFHIDSENLYESLDIATKSKDTYGVIK
ncbi:uncharacterized protein [Hyperolius riggenbachi]|uniref:uncharacterized protein n=1 Tax=Hyperolius riggenbachi TaxID=752182 RepID=UPI0035A2D337